MECVPAIETDAAQDLILFFDEGARAWRVIHPLTGTSGSLAEAFHERSLASPTLQGESHRLDTQAMVTIIDWYERCHT